MPAEWDAAFLAALPRVEAARDAEAYAAAVQGMLAALGDPATRVERTEKPPSTGPAPTLRALKSWEKDVLVLDLRNLVGPRGYATLEELRQTLDEDAAKARAVVLDLRMRGLQRNGLSWMVTRLLPQLMGVPKYRGRTVTLIDTRTMSQAEHTGLMLEAAADTLFLGGRDELLERAVQLLREEPANQPTSRKE